MRIRLIHHTIIAKHHASHALLFFVLLLVTLMPFLSSKIVLAAGISPDELFALTNSERAAKQLPAYKRSAVLEEAALAKANHMLSQGYFAHTAQDGTTGWRFMEQTGYMFDSAGENLAASNETALRVVDGWVNSPTHAANIFNTEYTEAGLAVVYKGAFTQNGVAYSNMYFAVALYAKPMTKALVGAPASSPTLTSANVSSKTQALPAPPTETLGSATRSSALRVDTTQRTIAIAGAGGLAIIITSWLMLSIWPHKHVLSKKHFVFHVRYHFPNI